jgi:hypothetical protein
MTNTSENYIKAYDFWRNPQSSAEEKAAARLTIAHGIANKVPFALAVSGSHYKELKLDTSRLSPSTCPCDECRGKR